MNPKEVTAGHDALGKFAPKFAQLNDDVLFGEVWSRSAQLALRDRSIVTVTALMACGILDSSLKFHLNEAKRNGVTKTEIVEIITHAAFYVGWPKAWAAFNMAKEIWVEENRSIGIDTLFPLGDPLPEAFAKYFIGNAHLCMLTTERVPIGHVTFEPSCRNNWHIHYKGGQILLVTKGSGWYQEWNKPAQALHPGDVVNIPPNVKHWHGAAKDSWFAHLAVEVPAEGASNEWLEAVNDEEYFKLNEY